MFPVTIVGCIYRYTDGQLNVFNRISVLRQLQNTNDVI